MKIFKQIFLLFVTVAFAGCSVEDNDTQGFSYSNPNATSIEGRYEGLWIVSGIENPSAILTIDKDMMRLSAYPHDGQMVQHEMAFTRSFAGYSEQMLYYDLTSADNESTTPDESLLAEGSVAMYGSPSGFTTLHTDTPGNSWVLNIVFRFSPDEAPITQRFYTTKKLGD